MENYHYKLTFGENGLLQEITDRRTEKTTKLGVLFGVYGTAAKKDKSGAYLFLPDGPAKALPSLAAPVVVETGPVLSRVTVKLDNVVHVVRLHNSPGKCLINACQFLQSIIHFITDFCERKQS